MSRFDDRKMGRFERDFQRREMERTNARSKEKQPRPVAREGHEERLQSQNQDDFSLIYGTDGRNPRPYQRCPVPRRVEYNCVLGIVERVPKEGDVNALPGFENKIAAVGYALYAEHTGERKPVFMMFSSRKEWPFFWMDTKTGDISDVPLNYVPEGMRMGFKENPEPVYHRTFTSHDPMQPTHCFESHVRNIAGGRINEMRKYHEDGKNVARYQAAVDDFLMKAGKIFIKAGQY